MTIMTNDELAARLRLAADILEGKNTEQKPAFQLPTPPPGLEWHRTDGWTEEMLPTGYRPVCFGERVAHRSAESLLCDGSWTVQSGDYDISYCHQKSFIRTTRPLTFTHEGHEWTWHKAGDPMPCDGDKMVYLMTSLWGAHTTPTDADNCLWEKNDYNPIIGWRYADVEKPDPYAELKKAHAEGKVIQVNVGTTLEPKWDDWCFECAPSFGSGLCNYRIKPDEIPWIEWHGGECPLKDEEVKEWERKYRNNTIRGGDYGKPSQFYWSHKGLSGDIIAYRVRKWREKKPICMTDGKSSIKDNLESIIAAMVNDPEYAWCWHCNIAMAAHDSGASPHDACNRGATLFLKLLSDGRVDTTTHPAYTQTQNTSVVKDGKPKKTVPLGPEDVPPGSVIDGVFANWNMPISVTPDGVYLLSTTDTVKIYSWSDLLNDGAKINRSIPQTGKWNPDAWEPCSKEVDA